MSQLLDTIRLVSKVFRAEENKVTDFIGDMSVPGICIVGHEVLSIFEAFLGEVRESVELPELG